MDPITVTINGRQISVEKDSTILEAARKAGFDIPTFCHFEELSPFTSCFICAVRIEGGKGNLVPSCATTVRDGMVVTVESEEINETRTMCLDLLLSDHCGDCIPPCEEACPASIDIRGFLELVAEGREAEAARLIREKAPFPGVLGRVCPRPCEDACRRNGVDEPISICFMKRYISDTELRERGKPVFERPASSTGKRIAIIGAGPAGMTAAFFLRQKGHTITVFEKKSQSGGMLRYGIPFYRLPDRTLLDEFGAVESMEGIELRFSTEIGTNVTAKELERDFDALLLALGAQGASPMRVPGEQLEGVHTGIDYLGGLASGAPPDVGKKVVVVGGGNTAIDVSRSVRRFGAEVTVLYRRSREEMPANDFEIDEALHEGVAIRFLTAPVEILPMEGESGGEQTSSDRRGDSAPDEKRLLVKCTAMELGEPDSSGRRRPVPIEDSELLIEADSVISAIGQRVLSDFVEELGVDRTRWGTIVSDERTFMTNRPGIFSFGDCQTGADIAVRAVGNGRRAAYAVHQYLAGEEVTGEPVLFNSTMGHWTEVDDAVFEGYEQQQRVEMPVLPDAERVAGFDEVETGFGTGEARGEAGRCLQCGCDAADDCKLRDYAGRFGADQKRFGGERRGYRKDESHDKIRMEIHKCISCGACVRACAEIKGLSVFSFVGRGFVTRMTAPFGRSLVDTACDGCGECAAVCPTAAIMKTTLED